MSSAYFKFQRGNIYTDGAHGSAIGDEVLTTIKITTTTTTHASLTTTTLTTTTAVITNLKSKSPIRQYGEDPKVCSQLIKYVEINNLVVKMSSKKAIEEAVMKLNSHTNDAFV